MFVMIDERTDNMVWCPQGQRHGSAIGFVIRFLAESAVLTNSPRSSGWHLRGSSESDWSPSGPYGVLLRRWYGDARIEPVRRRDDVLAAIAACRRYRGLVPHCPAVSQPTAPASPLSRVCLSSPWYVQGNASIP